ncbi:hypothetical protein [Novipirellula aureliae]|nr:hypothetical protein [Novipirellula aureliae]
MMMKKMQIEKTNEIVKNRAAKKKNAPLRFDETLVLNQWMLSLFNVGSFEKLAEEYDQ